MRKKPNETLAEAIPDKFLPHFESVFLGVLPSISSFQYQIKEPDLGKLLRNLGVPKSYTYGVVIRSYVNDLRRKAISPVCSSPLGYWTAKSEAEIDLCLNALNNRINGIQAAVKGLEELKKSLK